jgi:hypothetical protein
MTKEERLEIERRAKEKFQEKLRKLPPPPPPGDYRIVEKDDGKLQMITPWHQELDVLHSELYFWQLLCDLKDRLTVDGMAEYLSSIDRNKYDQEQLLVGFCKWALSSARDRAKSREKKRIESDED